MKLKTLTRTIGVMACVASLTSFQAAAQPQPPSPSATYRYRAVDLGTLGGPQSVGCETCRYINTAGSVAIFQADTPAPDPFQAFCLYDCYLQLGVKWQNGQETTLGALPGGAALPIWLSDSNLVSGYSENGLLDPATGSPEILAVLWNRGTNPVSLGTLGGTQSMAWAVNNAGQVVGGAANRTPDALANDFYSVDPMPFPSTTEIHAFLWDQGGMRDLKTLGGPDSFAQFVDASGRVAGFSFTNSTPNATTGVPTIDPFLWEQGAMRDLGSLGGTQGYPFGINDSGHIVGYSNLAGDATYHPFLWNGYQMIDLKTLGGSNGVATWINNGDVVIGRADLPSSQVHHAFLWKNGKMTDLGTTDSAPCTTAYGVNSFDQVVGYIGDASGLASCGKEAGGFLWEPGSPMVDVSTLFAPLASGLKLRTAAHIGDDGSILGVGKLPNGDFHMMLMIPCDVFHEDAPACHGDPGTTGDTAAMSSAPVVDHSSASGVVKMRYKLGLGNVVPPIPHQ